MPSRRFLVSLNGLAVLASVGLLLADVVPEQRARVVLVVCGRCRAPIPLCLRSRLRSLWLCRGGPRDRVLHACSSFRFRRSSRGYFRGDVHLWPQVSDCVLLCGPLALRGCCKLACSSGVSVVVVRIVVDGQSVC